ncbi:substrate-binding domain-containing protein [Paenibacillus abyssi]|uniref:Ribose ABC transporter substrate-binding protein n=1 Tax=Paenibacillus abyssi TaxID=1340531 RepID=A0A917CQG5_9BACL|nr:substrate-binding domain-containing protein [Paenibacillus abyssi]GGF94972.1 ribose ABC transporter substrate-binding protein [Paenibacillus abyssi]
MKKLIFVYVLLIGSFLLYLFTYLRGASGDEQIQAGLQGSIDEKYVMVTFQAGIDYWKSILKGFEDAAQTLNVSVEYRGSTRYDLQEQITVLEQVIAKKPAGIAISSMNPDALTPTINKAIDAGIPIVSFDSGVMNSKAYSLLATNNYDAGVAAAHKMAELVGRSGEVGVVTLPNQLNHKERTLGFEETIRSVYPKMRVVAVKDGKGDQVLSRQSAVDMMTAYPELKGIFNTDAIGGIGIGEAAWLQQRAKDLKIIAFDTDKGTLDMIKEGTISATIAQGTWNMGYWSLQFLFHLHHGLAGPMNGQSSSSTYPLPVYVDTGITVVTKENVDDYIAK